MKLRTKASLLIFLIIIVVMGVTGIYYLHFLHQSLKTSISAGIEGVANTTSQAISRFLGDSLMETQAIALALPVEALEKQDTLVIGSRLKLLWNIFPKFNNGMFIIDRNGRLWVDYPQIARGCPDISRREYFQKTLKEGRGIVGIPYVSRRTGKPVLTFTALLHGSANQVLGVLGCSVQLLSPDALEGIRKVKIGRSGYIYLFDTSRLMILHPEEARVMQRDIPPGANKLLDAAIAGFEGVGETVNSRGVPMLAAFKRIPGTGWIVAAQQPQSEAYAPMARVRQWLILGIILMVMIAILLVAIAIRRLTNPLVKLRQAVMFLGNEESNESQHVASELEKIKSNDEIGDLASAYLDISKKLDNTLISLKRANNDWERTFNTVPDFIAIIDLQHNIVKINQAMADRFGITPQDAVGLKCYHLIHGTDKPIEACPHTRLLEDGLEHTAEIAEERLGSIFWVTVSPLKDQDGKLFGSLHMAKDITERRQAEEALRESEQKLANIINFLPDATLVIDREGKVIAWNKAIEEMTGIKAEDMLGKGNYEYALPFYGARRPILIDLVLHPQAEIESKYLEIMEKEESTLVGEAYVPALKGREAYLRGTASVLFDSSGNIIGAIESIRDITERHKVKEALQRSEEKYRALMDNSSEGILVADTQGNFLEANKKITELLGYTKAELLTFNIIQIHPAEELARTSAAFQEILQRGSGGLDGGWVRRKDGKTIPVDITGSKVECGGETLIQEIFKDIRERQKAEAERLRFSKLESLGILAGGIAHDFNNILTAILGNIGLALLEGKMEGQLLERLSQAEKACLQAQGLARQLLTFAKGGAPIKKATSLPELCRESANLALAGSKARCEFSLPEDLWPVEVDAGQIHQVINNLLINADQAMPEGGRIKVQAENVLLAQKSALPLPQGKYVKLTIADQGIGIPSKYLDKIFDPYFTTKQKGSGLGLATAYSIIKNHSGYLSVESEVGVGTTFEIYLHALEGEPAVKKKEIEKPLKGQGRILVMDDEEMVLEVLSRALTYLGYEVELTKDGGQAIDKYAQAKESGRVYDGVILDLTVPGGMGGKETIEKLLKIDPQVKAIVSSGYSDDPILANFEDYGFSGVIAKPYNIAELSKILHEVIIKT